ncbi:hypothetical protein DFJ74DRAFT_710533 [Hyaloraphidium curvatum]|nr:hypothetical protein DFJ74DRAFT_710533 [Hyaloraphidium curvatum]
MYIFDYRGNDADHDFDPASRALTEKLLRSYMESGIVDYLPYSWTGELAARYAHNQAMAYDICMGSFGLRHEWIVVLDTDEFVEFDGIGEGSVSLADSLRRYENPGTGQLCMYH